MSATAYATSPLIETGAILDTSIHPEPQVGGGSQPVQQLFAIHGSAELPDGIKLGTLFDARFRVRQPIPVTLDRSGEGVSAVWHEIDEFGHADSASLACVELARSLVELYFTLDPEQTNLGPDLERVLDVLKQHIEYIQR